MRRAQLALIAVLIAAGSLACSLLLPFDDLLPDGADAGAAGPHDGADDHESDAPIDAGLHCDGGFADCNGDGVCERVADEKNCGACGRTCGGAACVNGACAPVVIAPDEVSLGVGLVAVDGDRVYWGARIPVDGGTTASHIVRALPDGGAREIIGAPGSEVLFGLTLDHDDVYWAATPGNRLRRMAKTGGPIEDVVTGAPLPINFFVVKGSDIFAVLRSADSGKIVSTTTSSGGAMTPLAENQKSPYGIAVDDARIYWTTLGNGATSGVSSMLRDGGAIEFAPTPAAQLVIADGASIFWTVAASPAVYTGSPALGSWRALFPPGSPAYDIVVDDTYVYWISGSSGASVMRARKDGEGDRVTLSSAVAIRGLAVDEASVYFVILSGPSAGIAKTPKR